MPFAATACWWDGWRLHWIPAYAGMTMNRPVLVMCQAALALYQTVVTHPGTGVMPDM